MSRVICFLSLGDKEGEWLNSLGMIYHTALRGSFIYLSSCIWFNTYGCMPIIIQCYFSHLYTLHLFIEQINWSPMACYLWLCLLDVWEGSWSWILPFSLLLLSSTYSLLHHTCHTGRITLGHRIYHTFSEFPGGERQRPPKQQSRQKGVPEPQMEPEEKEG